MSDYLTDGFSKDQLKTIGQRKETVQVGIKPSWLNDMPAVIYEKGVTEGGVDDESIKAVSDRRPTATVIMNETAPGARRMADNPHVARMEAAFNSAIGMDMNAIFRAKYGK